MLKLLKENRGYYIPFLLFLSAGAIVVSLYDKASVHLQINLFHFSVGDLLIPYLTWLGDGWFITIVCLAALLYKVRIALLLILSNLISSGITYFLKFQVYPDMDRPLEYFKGNINLHLIDGLDIHSHYTFPSGHATIAFASCTILSILVSDQRLKFLLFLLALFAAYTRVYLSQHFFNDIFAGAAIGTVTGTLVLTGMNLFTKGKKREWMERSILKK